MTLLDRNADDGFGVADGCLTVGGVPLPRLAERVGGTPFFAVSRRRITDRVALLRRSLPAGVELSYAIKANPMPAVVQHLAGLVDGFDVASAGEMATALDTPIPATRISFAGPGKTAAEIARAVAAGVTLTLESEVQAAEAAAAGERLGIRPRVAVRVNPDFEVRGSGLHMGGGAKAFGVDAEQVPALLRRIGESGLEFEGFHIFAGSQNLNAEALCAIQRHTVDLALALADAAPGPVRLLNLGGGFGIPYFPEDRPLDPALIGRRLEEPLARLRASLPGVRTVLELGRYLVGEAGVYVCRVIDRKVSRDRVFLVTDGGLHHHLAASGNLGQVIKRNYPVAIGNRMDEAPAETVDVVGCLCTPIDTLARGASLPRAEIGDLFVVFQSGAYGPTASPRDFLGHPHPAEVLL